MERIRLSKKQTLAWRELMYSRKAREIFMGGAAGPGKTWLGCLFQIHRRTTFRNTRGLIGRETRSNLYDTTLETFKDVAGRFWGMVEGAHYKVNQKSNRIIFDNGNFIYLRELAQGGEKPSKADFHKFGSMEFTDWFVDEAPECNLRAIQMIASRCRYNLIDPVLGITMDEAQVAGLLPKDPDNPQPGEYFGVSKGLVTGNPAPNWTKYRYIVDKKTGKPIVLPEHIKVIRAKLSDNPDPVFRAQYLQQLLDMPIYDQARLIDGNYDVNRNEKPFFPSFSRKKHSRFVDADPHEPLWLSFDFNMDPTVCIVGQKIKELVRDGGGCRVFKEYVNSGGTRALCKVMVEDGILDRPGPVLVTGDFSGNTRHTSAQNTDFEEIQNTLELPGSSFIHTSVPNKDHKYSRGICEWLFTNVPFAIDPGCNQTIEDIEIAQRTDQDKLRKDRDTFKMDLCDAFRYLVDAWFPEGIAEMRLFRDLIT